MYGVRNAGPKSGEMLHLALCAVLYYQYQQQVANIWNIYILQKQQQLVNVAQQQQGHPCC